MWHQQLNGVTRIKILSIDQSIDHLSLYGFYLRNRCIYKIPYLSLERCCSSSDQTSASSRHWPKPSRSVRSPFICCYLQIRQCRYQQRGTPTGEYQGQSFNELVAAGNFYTYLLTVVLVWWWCFRRLNDKRSLLPWYRKNNPPVPKVVQSFWSGLSLVDATPLSIAPSCIHKI